jgi:hypothetical protein
LLNGAFAIAILDLISQVHLPSFVKMLPKYLIYNINYYLLRFDKQRNLKIFVVKVKRLPFKSSFIPWNKCSSQEVGHNHHFAFIRNGGVLLT